MNPSIETYQKFLDIMIRTTKLQAGPKHPTTQLLESLRAAAADGPRCKHFIRVLRRGLADPRVARQVQVRVGGVDPSRSVRAMTITFGDPPPSTKVSTRLWAGIRRIFS